MGIVTEISFQIAPFNAEELHYLFIDTKMHTIFFHCQDLRCVRFFYSILSFRYFILGEKCFYIYIYIKLFFDSTPPTQEYN